MDSTQTAIIVLAFFCVSVTLLIVWPGEAKGELQKRIEKTQWTHRR
ncbi:MAG: hypothetical protein WBG91_09900 [Syntrophobacteria bacterium]